MTSWPWVLLPAMVTALIINFDARYSGPYFSLSSLISSTEGLEAHNFISNSELRGALLRRFAYPLVLGFGLAWHIDNRWDIGASGAIAAGLLVWPVLFHPLPSGVSRKVDVVILYITFIGSCMGISVIGAFLQALLVNFSDGRVLLWVENQMLWMFFVGVVALIFSAFYRSTFHRILRRVAK